MKRNILIYIFLLLFCSISAFAIENNIYISKITIEGNETISKNEIESYLGVNYNKNYENSFFMQIESKLNSWGYFKSIIVNITKLPTNDLNNNEYVKIDIKVVENPKVIKTRLFINSKRSYQYDKYIGLKDGKAFNKNILTNNLEKIYYLSYVTDISSRITKQKHGLVIDIFVVKDNFFTWKLNFINLAYLNFNLEIGATAKPVILTSSLSYFDKTISGDLGLFYNIFESVYLYGNLGLTYHTNITDLEFFSNTGVYLDFFINKDNNEKLFLNAYLNYSILNNIFDTNIYYKNTFLKYFKYIGIYNFQYNFSSNQQIIDNKDYAYSIINYSTENNFLNPSYLLLYSNQFIRGYNSLSESVDNISKYGVLLSNDFFFIPLRSLIFNIGIVGSFDVLILNKLYSTFGLGMYIDISIPNIIKLPFVFEVFSDIKTPFKNVTYKFYVFSERIN